MDAPPPDFGVLRWTSQQVAPRDRIDTWRHLLARKLLPVCVDPLVESGCEVDASIRLLPGLRFGTGALGSSVNRRTREIVASDNDDLFLIVDIGGTLVVSQGGRELTLEAGEATFTTCDGGESAFIFPTGGNILCFRIPRASLTPLVPRLDDETMRRIPAGTGALGLLVNYAVPLTSFLPEWKRQKLDTPELRHLVVSHILDLTAMAIGASRDAAAGIACRGIRAAQLQAIKGDVLAKFCRVDLSLGGIAARHHMTRRQVGRVFEKTGTTFSQFVLEQRLLRARRMLMNPRCRATTIAALAYESGFDDLSYFNRTFRHRFGATPSDVRVSAFCG